MTIAEYHAHVYYDEDSFQQAAELCQAAQARFGLAMGRMHRKPVGPHPCWSCQLTVPTALFGDVIPWLMEVRKGLTVFVHGVSGNDLHDHTALVLWLGESQPLELSLFE
jgi:aromatic ring-cleaving dioxygenase